MTIGGAPVARKSKLVGGFAEAVAGIPDGATIAFGGFAALPARDHYRIEVEVLRPGAAEPVRAVFPHRHFQP